MNRTLLYSADAGLTWDDFSLSGSQADITYLQFVDSLHGFLILLHGQMYAYTDGSVLKTSNGGLTWETITALEFYDGRLLAMDFVDEQTGYISLPEEGLAKTIDGGLTWEFLANPLDQEIKYIRFFTENQGVVVSDERIVACTADGGTSWDVVYDSLSATDTYNACYFTGWNSGWLAGSRGVIKRFTGTYTSFRAEAPLASPDFSVYPNPVSKTLNINYKGRIISWCLYNLKGEPLHSGSFPEANQIDVSCLSEGIYLLEAETDRGSRAGKFVKVR